MNNRPATMTSMLASRPRRRGFSLVELLLSIFILAIGIIAISAIFPAGILQQQQATDDVIGPIVAQEALGVLRSKLEQDDFGTFEQFGIYLDDQLRSSGGIVTSPVASPAPGDWTWMRPSYLLRGGIFAPQSPNFTPDPLHGAIDIFGLRNSREQENFAGYPGDVSLGNAGSPGSIFATSDAAVGSTLGNYAIPGIVRDNGNAYSGPEFLWGIPYNRNKHAILTPLNLPVENNVDRDGLTEPLVTILQSERSWPQGSEKPQYVWDCMFRRYQGRIQVAIFVYRVSAAGGSPRAYAVASGYDVGAPGIQGPFESPLPARVVLGDPDNQGSWSDAFWTPRGLDEEDGTNKLDDLVVPGTAPSSSVNTEIEPFGEGWQVPGQWLLDQNGNIHRVLAGRRTAQDGPVRLARPVPHVSRHVSNGNLLNAQGDPTSVDEASAVKAIWFIPPESRDGMILTPVFVTVRDL
jgi:prepilin-type N-terminal cleavage/methylation domain-containing protein